MLGAHDLQLGGSMAQFAASLSDTLAKLQEQSASPRPPPAARMEAAHRPTNGVEIIPPLLEAVQVIYKTDCRLGDCTIVGNHVS